jgi:polyvinyl alcohol dehydrogenase (cytochrome)
MRALAALSILLLACGGSSGGSSADRPGVDPPVVEPPGAEPEPPAASDWPQFRRDARGTSASAAPFPARPGMALPERWRTAVGPSVYGQPLVVGDTVYATAALEGSVAAYDAASGALRWSRALDGEIFAACDGGPSRPGIWGAAAVAGGVVYAAAPDGFLYALDAATGEVRWRAQVADGRPHGELVQSSVTISEALRRAYVGVASTAHCDQIAGRVVSVDLDTGEVVALTLVGAGQRGAAVWSSPSVDEADGLVFVATGNAIGDPADEPLAQAIVALDARTLEVRGSWQNPTSLEDADFGASPTLFEAGGRKLVAAAGKDGMLFVLDRDRLEDGPVWSLRIAQVDPAQPDQGGDPLAGFGSIVSPTFANGLLYAAGGRTPDGARGAVWALEPATGAVRFVRPTPGFVLRELVAAGGVLVVTSNTGSGSALEVLDARTGAGLARLDREVTSFAPVSVGSGVLLWATADGVLAAYGVPAE